MKILPIFAWLYPSYAQMHVAAAVVGSAVVGGVVSSNAAGKAADAQSAAAGQADATQRYMYDQTRADNAPFRESGVAANNRLAYMLGIGGTTGAPAATSLANSSLTSGTGYNASLYNSNDAYRKAWDEVAGIHQAAYGKGYNSDSDMGWVEQQVRARLGPAYEAERLAAEAQAAQNNTDPMYGSLLKKFGQSDLDNDVVYQSGLQFGLDQGTQGINRQAAASGNQLSGATLKALTRFGNDYGSTKANEAYNRYNTTNDSIYNKLAGVSGAGQQSTNQVAAAGQNMANNISQNQIGLGNARGASAIAGANSFNNALSSGVNAYQQQNYLNSLSNNGYGGYNDEMTRLMGQT